MLMPSIRIPLHVAVNAWNRVLVKGDSVGLDKLRCKCQDRRKMGGGAVTSSSSISTLLRSERFAALEVSHAVVKT